MSAWHGRDARRGPRQPGGRLLWLWLLLGAVVLVLLAYAVGGALDDDGERESRLPPVSEGADA